MVPGANFSPETMFRLQASHMNNLEKQEHEEMTVFGEFAKVCPLPLLLNTAQNRPTPEPDILCDIESGKKLAFELAKRHYSSFGKDSADLL